MILAALLAAAQPPEPAPPQMGEAHRLGHAWGYCVGSTAAASIRRGPSMPVEAAVDGAMETCVDHEERLRAHWAAEEGEESAATYFPELRGSVRERAISRLGAAADALRERR